MNSTQAENRDLTDRDINQPKETHKGVCYLALTFGTLLSSQRADAHRTRPRRALVDGGFSCAPHDGRIPADLPAGPEPGVSRGASRTLHHSEGSLQGGCRQVRSGDAGRPELDADARPDGL